ncbi:MAG: HD family phosphohydrolase [Dehalococcoidia bacterium]
MTSDRESGRGVSRMRAVIFSLAFAAVAGAALVPLTPAGGGVREGDRASTTLSAERAAQFESDALTEAVRAEQSRKVAERYFPPDPTVREQQLDKLQTLLDEFRAIRLRTDLSRSQQLSDAAKLTGVSGIPAAQQFTLLEMDAFTFRSAQERTLAALSAILQGPVEPGKAADRVEAYLAQPNPAADIDPPGTMADVALASRELLKAFVVENVRVDQQATQKLRDEARAAVAPVTVTYSRGQVIVNEGNVLSAADIEALRRTGVINSGYDFYKAAGGIIAALSLGIVVFAFAAGSGRPSPAAADLAAIWMASAAVLLGARFALPLVMPDRDQHFLPFALPFAGAAVLATFRTGPALGACIAAVSGVLVAFIAGAQPALAGSTYVGPLQSLELAAVVTAGGLAGSAMAARKPTRPGWVAGAGLAVTAASGAILAFFWLITDPRNNDDLAWMASAAASAGAGTALAVGLFSAVASWLGPRSLASRLAELSQPGHPLQARLRDEAPGTYHHSQMVASLAERAASRIGADAALARVGAMYHDIGKLGQPAFYVENFAEEQVSPHDGLPHGQSAAIIREHVSRGVELARHYGLPGAVADFIPQHHGTRLVTYFYRQATETGGPVDASDFRYAGPRPQSREAAIVMLADSCEAIVRADPDRQGRRIDQLVDTVLGERVSEGELDECDLTMRDLRAVGDAFKETLRAVYHPRIAYPMPSAEELAGLARG